jgi:acyl-coenzyme A synthetase/AMP-(fatty) acid ligase
MTSDGASLTYSQLVDEAQHVAGSLHASGVASGDKACLLMKPGINAIKGMLVIVWVRCCYVFLDSDFAPERLAMKTRNRTRDFNSGWLRQRS